MGAGVQRVIDDRNLMGGASDDPVDVKERARASRTHDETDVKNGRVSEADKISRREESTGINCETTKNGVGKGGQFVDGETQPRGGSKRADRGQGRQT